MQPTTQQKQTPNRRRPGGRTRNNPQPQQKAYVSENDLCQYKPDQHVDPSTPQKIVSGAGQSRANSTGQKQRGKNNNQSNNQGNNQNTNHSNKPRNKNGAVSPRYQKQDRPSPSLKPDTSPIFAGATFHASPAPSALPMPSFLSKSAVDSPLKITSSPEADLSSPLIESDEASPSSPPSVPHTETEESPLELFFRAHRAEKAKTRRASSSNTDVVATGPFSPPREESPKECNTYPKPTTSSARRPNYSKRHTNSGISPDELDGNPGQPVGPAFSTPYHERMRAARSNQSSAQATPTMVRNHDLNSSDALKRYLFTGRLGPDEERSQPMLTPTKQPSAEHKENAQQARQQSQRRSAPQYQPTQHRLPRGMFPASVLTANAQSAQSPAPPAHAHFTSHRSEQILTMEDSLKRMLKLDSPSRSLPLH
ncbi:hypothetical protein F4819DRAFT_438264 [Hypoxylon fuscum]|nr:hypothetical protein F4819DRAFT_438264 [Hypoxylon fuscum]